MCCKYCGRPHYEITLPCIGAEVIEYPKDDNDQWVIVQFKYECPQCGTIWTSENFCRAE